MRLKDIPVANRPRERLKEHGIGVLSDAELLALVLKTGSVHENVIDVANRLIRTYGMERLATCSLRELQKIQGIGPAKAAQLLAMFACHTRVARATQPSHITCAEDVYTYMEPVYRMMEEEQCRILSLNVRKRILNEHVLPGALDSVVINPRDVFRYALQDGAHAIILVHNHPSGDPTPSKEDKHVTKWLTTAGNVLNIPVLDHIIIGKKKYYSFEATVVATIDHLS